MDAKHGCSQWELKLTQIYQHLQHLHTQHVRIQTNKPTASTNSAGSKFGRGHDHCTALLLGNEAD